MTMLFWNIYTYSILHNIPFSKKVLKNIIKITNKILSTLYKINNILSSKIIENSIMYTIVKITTLNIFLASNVVQYNIVLIGITVNVMNEMKKNLTINFISNNYSYCILFLCDNNSISYLKYLLRIKLIIFCKIINLK